MVGSTCLAAGSLPATASLIGDAAGWVFFVGSSSFTSAAYLQHYEASHEAIHVEGHGRTRRLVGLQIGSIGMWAAVVQLIGTFWFNISTFNALRDLAARQEEALAWAPDAFGSICFHVASGLALVEVWDKLRCRRSKLITWSVLPSICSAPSLSTPPPPGTSSFRKPKS
jgi:hypothetical protein